MSMQSEHEWTQMCGCGSYGPYSHIYNTAGRDGDHRNKVTTLNPFRAKQLLLMLVCFLQFFSEMALTDRHAAHEPHVPI